MGYLFTLDDIRQHRIPTEEDFLHMQDVIEAALEEPYFLAASLFGSLPRGDWTLRSDIDVLAVTRQADHQAARACLLDLASQSSQRHIRLSAHVHTVSEARRGEHPFDSSHRLTMRELATTGFAKGLPHQWYLCPGQDIRPDMLNRLCRVLAATTDGAQRFAQIKSDRGLDEWIVRSWEQGVRPMRLYLGFMRWLMWWEHQALFPDGKQEVLKAFLAEPAFADYHADVLGLRQIDLDYDVLFEAARKNEVSGADYQPMVRRMVAQTLSMCVGTLSRAIGKLGPTLGTFARVAA